MKIKAVLSAKPCRTRKEADPSALSLHILTGVIAAGILFGVLMFLMNRPLFAEHLTPKIQSFFTDQAHTADRFLGFLCSDGLLFLILLLCGTSAYGKYFLSVLLFLKASGFGASAGIFMQSFAQAGIGTYFLCVYPGRCLLFLAMLMMGQNCIHTGEEIRKAAAQEGSANKRFLTLFALRSAIIFALFLITDLLNAALPTLLGRSFSLSDSMH